MDAAADLAQCTAPRSLMLAGMWPHWLVPRYDSESPAPPWLPAMVTMTEDADPDTVQPPRHRREGACAAAVVDSCGFGHAPAAPHLVDADLRRGLTPWRLGHESHDWDLLITTVVDLGRGLTPPPSDLYHHHHHTTRAGAQTRTRAGLEACKLKGPTLVCVSPVPRPALIHAAFQGLPSPGDCAVACGSRKGAHRSIGASEHRSIGASEHRSVRQPQGSLSERGKQQARITGAIGRIAVAHRIAGPLWVSD